MRFPDLLYLPSEFEVAKAAILPQRMAARAANSGTVTSLVRGFGPIPREFALVLTNAVLDASSGAAQTVTGMSIVITQLLASGAQGGISTLDASYPTTLNAVLAWQGEAVLMPGEFIILTAAFSAGGALNSTEASVHGYLIPRSNLQQGVVPTV